ncbi:MAG: NAD(P)H-hydrate dehydratase [Clostridiaceae bacterium]
MIELNNKLISPLIPKRTLNSNKGTYGRALFLTGSLGMTGSGYLCGKAAFRCGVGLVYLAVPNSLLHIYGVNLPESIQIPLASTERGIIKDENSNLILNEIKHKDVLCFGPGLTSDDNIKNLAYNLLPKVEIPMVIDADGLNVIGEDKKFFPSLNSPVVITPHPGEMSRLTGLTIKEIQENRVEVCKRYSVDARVITVLKGNKTVISTPDGEVFINTTGNTGMATAGTGDVLAGMISSFIAQGASPKDAAIAGVYLHGLSGDIASEFKGEHSLMASDLVEHIPLAFKKILS